MNYYLTNQWLEYTVISKPFMENGRVWCQVDKGDNNIQQARMYTEIEKLAHESADNLARAETFHTYEEEVQKQIVDSYANLGFDWRGITFCFVGDGLYELKDKLKQYNCKFTKELGWHCADTLALPSTIKQIPVRFSDAFAWDFNFKKLLPKLEVTTQYNLMAQKSSAWIGEIGQKITDVPVTYTKYRPYTNRFGSGFIYTFVTEEGYELVWMTKTTLPVEVGMEGKISGIVKDKSEFNGAKQTVLKNVKFHP